MKLRFLLPAFLAILMPCVVLAQEEEEESPGSTDASANYNSEVQDFVSGSSTLDYFGASDRRIALVAYNPSGVADITTAPVLEKTPDLVALAHGLDDDPVRIFNFVRNYIESEFYFGLKKGPRMTYLDRSGNDLDKAFLLAALLKIADEAKGGSASIQIAHGMDTMSFSEADGVTPDICSLWKLDPNAMSYSPGTLTSQQLRDWYIQKTPYIHDKLRVRTSTAPYPVDPVPDNLRWEDLSWRKTSLAFYYAAKSGYNNPSRMTVPASPGALSIRRFYVKVSNLQGASGTYVLDPWKVRYNRTTPVSFPVDALGDLSGIVEGSAVGANLWQFGSSQRNWYANNLAPKLSDRAMWLLNGRVTAPALTGFKDPSMFGSLTCDQVLGRYKLQAVEYSSISAAATTGVAVVAGSAGEPHVIRDLAWRVNFKFGNAESPEKIVFFPSLAGRRLSVHTESNNTNYSLVLGAERHLFGTDFSIDPLHTHPLGSASKANLESRILTPWNTFGELVTVSYERNGEAPEHLRAAHAIFYGFSSGNGILAARRTRFEEMLQFAEFKYPGSTTGHKIAWQQLLTREDRRPIVLEALFVQGLDWLAQTALARRGVEDVFGVNLTKTIALGRMSQNGGYFIDAYQQVAATCSRDGNYNERGGEVAALYAGMFLESALEHSIIEQADYSVEMFNGARWMREGASTVNIIDALHSKNTIGSPAIGVLVPELGTNTPPSSQRIALDISNASYTAFFEKYANAVSGKSWAPPPIAITVYQGKSVFALHPPPSTATKAFDGSAYLSPMAIQMSVGVSSGGYCSLPLLPEPRFVIDDLMEMEPLDFFMKYNKQPTYVMAPEVGFGADPVNVATGAFEHAEEDLKIGSGEAPMGLSFRRDYDSSRARADVAGLGFGWTHNWDIRLSEGTNAPAALGATIPRHMAPFVVSLKMLEETLIPPKWGSGFQGYDNDSIDPRRWMVVNGIAKWCVDQISCKAITATMGKDAETFIRTPDGEYESGAGSTMKLTVGENGLAKLQQRLGNTIEFTGLYLENDAPGRGRATRIVGPYGQEVTFVWNDNGVSSVSSNAGDQVRKLAFTYANTGSNHLTGVTEYFGSTAGRSVAFSQAGGNLVSSTDPENLSPAQTSMSGGSMTYGYSPAGSAGVACCLQSMRDPMGREVVYNIYDFLGRVVAQDSGVIERSGGDLQKPWTFRYSGVMNQEIDPLGGIKRHFYNDSGKLVRLVDALGLATITSYDTEDRTVETVDPRGAKIVTTYDTKHNVTKISEYRRAGVTPYETTTTYDSESRPVLKTDPLGRTTAFTYYTVPSGQTPVGDPATVTQGDAEGTETTTYTYWGSGFSKGLPHTVSDELGTLSTTTYTRGLPTQVTVPNPSPAGGTVTTTTSYNSQGDPTTVTDVDGRVDTFSYNNRRQVKGHIRKDPDSGVMNPYQVSETSLYDAAGRLAYEAMETGRDGGKKTKGYEYLSTGKPTYARDGGADGVLWTADDSFELKVYDEREWLVKEFDINGNVTQTNYLANGWKDSVALPPDPKLGSRVTSSLHDNAGRVTKATDVLSRETNIVYQEHSSGTFDGGPTGTFDLTETTGPDSKTTKEWKDAMGNQRVLSDKRTKRYVMTYDAWNRLTQTDTPEGRFFKTSYLADGRVNTVTKGQGLISQTAQSTYGTGRQLTGLSWPGKSVTYNSYTKTGKLVQATEATKTVERTYDYFDRVKTYKNADGWTIGYEYYNDGMLKRIYYPDSATDTYPFDNDSVLYNYDQRGRLLTITDWANRVTTYSWRSDGRLNSITRPNGTVRQLIYDSLSRVAGFTERTSGGTLIHVQRLDYRKTDDLASSFTSPAKPTSGGTPQIALTSATFGDDNTIAYANDKQLGTDSRGNLTTALVNSATATSTLSYDERDRLTGIDSTVDTSFVYDLEGNRRSMTHGGATTNYVFDPDGGALVRMLVRIDPSGKKIRYVYGVGLDYEVDQSNSQAKYYHYDFTGSTAAITNQSGVVTDRYYYSPYGQIVHSTGTTDTPFKFCGFMGVITDPNGLLSMRARFYSPLLCRFVSMDPAKFEGGMNWYAYASGNPLALGDPSGFGPESTLDLIQTGLSVLGMAPVVGFAFDLVNAGISVARGNYGEAAMSAFSAIPGIGDAFGAAKAGASAFRAADIGFDMGSRFASGQIGELGLGTFSKLVNGRIKSAEMTSIGRILRQQHGTTIHFNSSLALKEGNGFFPELNQIHLKAGPSQQRRGLFYEEVQHAFDHHAGAYEKGWSDLKLHSVTARNIAANPLLPTTAADNAALLKQADIWWTK